MPKTSGSNPYEPDLAEEVSARSSGLRTGFTTGTVAAAAAKAAIMHLMTQKLPESVQITLPNESKFDFTVLKPKEDVLESVKGLVTTDSYGAATVIKDAGDDPDCTHGAEFTVVAFEKRLSESSKPEIEIIAGPGIGTVTLNGLGIDVGKPSITKIPLKMISESVRQVNTTKSFVLIITVPGGVEMAAKTTNDRLGIVGGISILGTTGIVKPFSTAAYRASVVQQINVARVQRLNDVILVTGFRTEQFAFKKWPKTNKLSIVEVGDFTGIAIKRSTKVGFNKITFVGMCGKIVKLADGIMMTHYKRSNVNTNLLLEIAMLTNAPEQVKSAATDTNTARHFAEVCMNLNFYKPLFLLCKMAADSCRTYAGSDVDIAVYMTDFEGATEIANSL